MASKSPKGDIAPSGFEAMLLVANCYAIGEPGVVQTKSPLTTDIKKTAA